jgi:hypothetical protein
MPARANCDDRGHGGSDKQRPLTGDGPEDDPRRVAPAVDGSPVAVEERVVTVDRIEQKVDKMRDKLPTTRRSRSTDTQTRLVLHPIPCCR